MTVRIAPRRTGGAGTVPTVASLVDGEMAVNYTDGKIFQRIGAAIILIGTVGIPASGGTMTGTLTFGGMTAHPIILSGDFTANGRTIELTNTNVGTTSTIGLFLNAGATASSQIVQVAAENATAAVANRVLIESIVGDGIVFSGFGGGDFRWVSGSTRLTKMTLSAAGALSAVGTIQQNNGEYVGPLDSEIITLAANLVISAAHKARTIYNNTATARTVTINTGLDPGMMFQVVVFSTGTITLTAGAGQVINWMKGDASAPVTGNRIVGRGGWATCLISPAGQVLVTGVGIT